MAVKIIETRTIKHKDACLLYFLTMAINCVSVISVRLIKFLQLSHGVVNVEKGTNDTDTETIAKISSG